MSDDGPAPEATAAAAPPGVPAPAPAPGQGGARRIRLFVDEIGDVVARVLVGEQVLSLSLTLLPEGVREGDWVELAVGVIPPPAQAVETAERRRRLAADDPGGPIKL